MAKNKSIKSSLEWNRFINEPSLSSIDDLTTVTFLSTKTLISPTTVTFHKLAFSFTQNSPIDYLKRKKSVDFLLIRNSNKIVQCLSSLPWNSKITRLHIVRSKLRWTLFEFGPVGLTERTWCFLPSNCFQGLYFHSTWCHTSYPEINLKFGEFEMWNPRNKLCYFY